MEEIVVEKTFVKRFVAKKNYFLKMLQMFPCDELDDFLKIINFYQKTNTFDVVLIKLN